MRRILVLLAAVAAAACSDGRPQGEARLVGAWKSKMRFEAGTLATLADLELMYSFNSGGTLTESSNYDSAPPVPPAYGIWRETAPGQYEARYEFYITRAPTAEETAGGSVGWLPGGRGLLIEKIALAKDGNSFESEVDYEVFDAAGRPVEGGGKGRAHGVRIAWP